MATLGLVMLGLALIASVLAVGSLLAGHNRKGGEMISKLGYWGTYVAAGSLTIAVTIMVVAFYTKDFTFLYVAENHSPDVSSLAWLYTLSALWAGREGSFLFWTWLISLFAAWIAYRRINLMDSLSNMGLMVTNVVMTLFASGMLFSQPNNPFKLTDAGFLGPAGELVGEAAAWGMNPLLQHWAMIAHPPTLFIGYAGLTIPFAFAVAAIIVNDGSDAWVRIVDRITVFSWLFLGAGIGLGSVWAYVVLGWGGYWGWDPVENASLLPWLTGVGLLHSFTIYRKRGGFKKWAIALSSVTFALVILGTFITRSGIVQSVHAFEADPVSLYLFLAMILVAFAVAIFGPMLRKGTFEGNDEFESLTGKEAAYYFNNVIMLVAGLLVAYLTITSALPSWMLFGKRSIPPSTFDAVARPVGVLYVFIVALCPMLSWRTTEGKLLWSRIKWPLVSAAAIFALLVVEFSTTLKPIYDRMVLLTSSPGLKMAEAGPAWYYHAIGLLGLFAGSLLISTTGAMFITGAKKRAEARGESFGAALWSILSKARSQSGGYLAHIGIGIILIGLVGSAMYVYDNTYTIPQQQGAKFTVDQYTFNFVGTDSETLKNGNTVDTINLQVTRGGKVVGTINPGQTTFAATQQTRTDARVLSEPLRDIFVTMQGADESGISINVKINPLIWFSWGGFIILLIGTSIATWPKAGARELVVAGAPLPKTGKAVAKTGKQGKR
ncbi:MAG: cytochrome c biogenesis protein CcsA [Coriobacteriia bacterium]|nr:cytochrome c biogenesis protein CcsA [Coriobacteriia bacterium]